MTTWTLESSPSTSWALDSTPGPNFNYLLSQMDYPEFPWKLSDMDDSWELGLKLSDLDGFVTDWDQFCPPNTTWTKES